MATRPAPRRAWWIREALADDPGEPCPPLSRDLDADVLIIGGGFTGLWTAYALTEAEPAMRVAVLEQDICGGGPSGRNGGFVNSWWSSLDEIADMFGDEAALALCRAGGESAREIGEFCRHHAVDAWFTYAGVLGVATSPATDRAWEPIVRAAERMGAVDLFALLSADEVRARCNSPSFMGGLLELEAATVQPARLARGLRRGLP